MSEKNLFGLWPTKFHTHSMARIHQITQIACLYFLVFSSLIMGCQGQKDTLFKPDQNMSQEVKSEENIGTNEQEESASENTGDTEDCGSQKKTKPEIKIEQDVPPQIDLGGGDSGCSDEEPLLDL